jgi:hypothetical protein
MTAVLQGRVTRAGAPVQGAYVRLLDSTGELTGETVTADNGGFTFETPQGEWMLRALSPNGSADARLTALAGATSQTELAISA